MIDLHCHLLPGIDDGPPDMATALEMARAHVAAGVGTVVCTPHVTHDLPNDAARIAAAVETTRAALADARVPLEILPGAEIAITKAADLDDDALRALALGGGPWLLVEAPLRLTPGVDLVVQSLLLRGHRVVVAHPERSPFFQRDADALRRLVAGGALVQLTTGSLTGQFGTTVRRFADALLREGLVHNIASDAHDAHRRPPGLREPLEAAGWGDLTAWTTDAVPRALLTGETRLPDAPPPAPPRRGLLDRLRRS